jgi:hypothetical protein
VKISNHEKKISGNFLKSFRKIGGFVDYFSEQFKLEKLQCAKIATCLICLDFLCWLDLQRYRPL